MDIDLDALQAKAEAATPGTWDTNQFDDQHTIGNGLRAGEGRYCVAGNIRRANDAAFIAAANPAVVLELVARLRAAEARADRLEAENAELRTTAQAVLTHFNDRSQAPGHCHDVPGIWDTSNLPDIAGKPCEWCATWAKFTKLAGGAQ